MSFLKVCKGPRFGILIRGVPEVFLYLCSLHIQESVELWRVAVGLSDVLLGGYLDQIHSMQ